MGAGGWFILGGIGLVLVPFLFAPFMLSSRISREEEAEDYRRLVADLKRVQARKCAERAANEDHSAPLDLVHP
jgi:hypothetical protein